MQIVDIDETFIISHMHSNDKIVAGAKRAGRKYTASENSSPACIIDVDNLQAWMSIVGSHIKTGQQKILLGSREFRGGNWVYRGQGNADWEIESSFRRQLKIDCSKILSIERHLRGKEAAAINSFIASARDCVRMPVMTKLDWLMLMRHHGVPTRLVDFTENPSIALYFAIEGNSGTDFAVWALKRDGLVNTFLSSEIGRKLPGYDELVSKYGKNALCNILRENRNDPLVLSVEEYLENFTQSEATSVMLDEFNRKVAGQIINTPLTDRLELPNKVGVVSFKPQTPSPRMRAQRGLFIMPLKLSEAFMAALFKSFSPGSEKSMEDAPRFSILEAKERMPHMHDLKLIKFVFGAKMKEKVRDYLLLANCACDNLYPDVEGVARAVTRQVMASLSGYVNVAEAPGMSEII